ncbi:CoA pyrophosphatase [Sphingomonas sp. ASV193]|uniref:CoA pyrophosphatase n=1 Tax=Sphingomonas sp. ASV193 TaxID=3144405 RepID=UPI0032E8F895
MSLAERLAAALRPAPDDLIEGDGHLLDEAEPRDAAVLVAVTDRPRPGVILTQRRADLRLHAGQVAFPGGRIDEGETAPQAALREAWEEIALDPAAVALVAAIDRYRTVTGYTVTPVLAAVPPDLPLVANPGEVADWFEVPLDHLLDPANQQRRSAMFRGAERRYVEIMWQDKRIWGATAAMIVNLSRRLDWR